jgi:2-hydroxy-6-oxonona-2,4-dienedioate hydrolase
VDTTAFEHSQGRLLRRYGVEASSRFIEIDGPVRRAHALESGSGPPVVLVHGGGSFAAHWAPLMAQLSGYRLIAVDRPGHGLSDPFVYPKDIDLRSHAVDFLENVLDALGLDDEVAMVGNSMGGLWSFWLALDRPRRVGAIVQVGTPALVLETGAPLGLRLTTAPLLGRALQALERPSRAQVLKLFGRLGDRRAAERPRELVDAFEQAEPLFGDAWVSLLKRCTGPIQRRDISIGAEELNQVEQPVKFVWGDHDPFGSPDVGRRATAAVPDASIDFVPAGHVPWPELPEQVGAIVQAFLDRRASVKAIGDRPVATIAAEIASTTGS